MRVITEFEACYSDFDKLYEIIPYVFNEDIRQALRILDYTITYKLHRDCSSFDFIEEEDDDYEAPDWLNDELQYFVEMYQDTFK